MEADNLARQFRVALIPLHFHSFQTITGSKSSPYTAADVIRERCIFLDCPCKAHMASMTLTATERLHALDIAPQGFCVLSTTL